MKPTRTLLDGKTRAAILEGVNAVYEPVRRTFGPQGRNALIYRTFNRGPRITNDGHTVAQVIEPKDIFTRLVANAFKEAPKRTNEKAGDGTTLTTILAGKLYNEIHPLLNQDNSSFVKNAGSIGVMTLKKNLEKTANFVKEEIKKQVKEISSLEDLEKIATVSVENPELGKVIAKLAWDVGVDGFIDVTDGFKGEIETDIIKGFRFPAKVPAKAFVNRPEKYEMLLDDYYVIVTNYAIDNANQIGRVLQKLQAFTSKIAIVAPSFSENVLINMVNATKAGFSVCPVHTPSHRTEQFEDLAIYCGAKFIDKGKGISIESITQNDLGFISKLIVKDTENREDAVATGGRGEIEKNYSVTSEIEVEKKGKKVKEKQYTDVLSSPVQERVKILKGQLNEMRIETHRKLLERRIASMASGIGVIRVGDSTEASSLYQKLKIEDAVYACKAALRGGYVRGGGLCLKSIAEILPDDDIMKSVLIAPYEQIQETTGGIEIGEDVIDPAEAIIYAVEHAVGVVSNLATVEIIVQEMDDPIHGEGELAIAKMIGEFNLTQKRHLGLIKESEEEAERDYQNKIGEMFMEDNDHGHPSN